MHATGPQPGRKESQALNAREYSEESAALDAELATVIGGWRATGAPLSEAAFNSMARRIFAHQLRHNAAYAQFCASLGVTPDALPSRWEEIPPVPVTAFKDAHLATFDPGRAALRFETSGTTQGRPGVHFMETATLYDAALLAGFERAMVSDGARLRYLNVLARPWELPQSSLAYMMGRIAQTLGDGAASWHVRGDDLLVDSFAAATRSAISDNAAVCIAGTAFGLVNLIDALAERREQFTLPEGSRIMETGGFKGRARVIDRLELYQLLAQRFGIQESAIVAEYGMTELTSQYYDSLESRGAPERVKSSPPWLRARVLDPSGVALPVGEVGTLVHVDLANRSSALAIATDDRGYRTESGFVLLGREERATLRGCSLDAEALRASRMPARRISRITSA